MSHTTIDAMLSALWTLTYTLVFIGTEKYRYPLFAPQAQLMIASLEYATMICLLVSGIRWENHVFISYLCWTILETAILVSNIRQGFIQRKHVVPYLAVLALGTLLVSYFLIYQDAQLFFALFNTAVGEVFWLIHIRKKDYPMRPMIFAMFLAKFVADAMSVPVYFGQGTWLHSLMGILIPTLDFLFIHVYLSQKDSSKESITNK